MRERLGFDGAEGKERKRKGREKGRKCRKIGKRGIWYGAKERNGSWPEGVTVPREKRLKGIDERERETKREWKEDDKGA